MSGAACDRLDRATDALAGIADLLVSIERSNLHQVDPGNLYALLELVREALREGHDGLCRGGSEG